MSLRNWAFFILAALSISAGTAMARSEVRVCHWNGIRYDERELRFSFDPQMQIQSLQAGQPLFTDVSVLDARASLNSPALYCYISKERSHQELVVDCYNSRWSSHVIARMRFPLKEGRLAGSDPVFAFVDPNGEDVDPESVSCAATQSGPTVTFDSWLLGTAMSLGLFSGTCL